MTLLFVVGIIEVVLSFIVIGCFAFRQYQCCKEFNEQDLPPELRNYD
ncbi:hypothetical protein SMKC032_29400 [Serratia marcescens]|nr:hypothetical protein SMKC032_29400 [Serratia marcescens]